MVGAMVCMWCVASIWIFICLLVSKRIESDVFLSPELLRVARLHQSAERQAMREQTEAVLVGGPSCGESVVVGKGQGQWTEVRGGIYYRWERTDRVSHGQVVFELTKIVPCWARRPIRKAK